MNKWAPQYKHSNHTDSNMNAWVPNSDGNYDVPIRSKKTISSDGKIEVYFDDIEEELIRKIDESDVVCGCVAWLTNEAILTSLAEKEVSIVVQKEDFLKPDSHHKDNWKTKLRMQYDKLQSPADRYTMPGTLHFSQCNDPTLQPIRCCGNHNRNKKIAFPRCHHKFVIFGKYNEQYDFAAQEIPYDTQLFYPYAVWTGSFNFSKNAGDSLENAVVIKDLDIVNSYYQEYLHVLSLSERLDWETDWACPEWRIGT